MAKKAPSMDGDIEKAFKKLSKPLKCNYTDLPQVALHLIILLFHLRRPRGKCNKMDGREKNVSKPIVNVLPKIAGRL